MADADYYEGKGAGPYWTEQIGHAQKVFEIWESRGDKVVARYRDERLAGQLQSAKFNILWANTQVLFPSLYGRPAKPEVSRRHMDSDPAGRLASVILERTLDYEVNQFPDFDATMRGAVEDRLLPGRGSCWLKADTADIQEGSDREYSPAQYVYWKDFLHSPARVWEEVWWVARRTYIAREEGIARFGDVFANVPLAEYKEDHAGRQKDRPESASAKKAVVWEIWNKRTRRVCWIAKDYGQQELDEKPDPLELEGFFPCPKPLLATTTTGSLVPVPDYCEYQDQAEELDRLTRRINKLVEAIKAVGVSNAEFKELTRLLQEGTDNKIFPVTQWAALSEKGGLKGAVELLDLTTQLQALGALYQARESVKQTIYEICGISDILRGQTKAEETLGAQQLKANFGSLRLRSSQVDVARYATDIFRLKAQIICKLYPDALLIRMSGIANTPDGQNEQLVRQAIELLRNSTVRDFHIAVESDSLAQIDEAQEKAEAAEAMQAIGGFVREAVPMAQMAPETLPMVRDMLLFLVRRYRAGRELEASIEQTMAALQQKAAAMAQNPPPSAESMEAQARMQGEQLRIQADTQSAQMKATFDAQVQQSKLAAEAQLEQMKAHMEERMAKLEGQIKLAVANVDAETKITVAQIQSETQLAIAGMNAQAQAQSDEKKLEGTKIEKGPPKDPELTAGLREVSERIAAMEASSKKPRVKKVVRDKEGRIARVEELVN